MSSNQWLEMLPSELHLRIISHLTPHDLSKLACTCQRFNGIITPLIWDDIELHEDGYHESKHELDVPPPARDPARRPYHPRPWEYGQVAEMRAEAFFTMLQTTHKQDFERFEHITKRVRHLCTVIDPSWQPRNKIYDIIDPEGIQVWQLLPYFSNLETLELYGNPGYNDWNKKAVEILGPTPRLRFAKLWGYMPRAVPAWLLRSGETLERLELGMLDRPISTCLATNPECPPLPSENLNADAEGDDDESDYGSLYAENVIPRPLGGYLSSYDSDDLVFPKLKHLYLCQPSESLYFDDFKEYGWSKRAESACHDDWRRIMQSCVGTLETLVLEQRPAAEYIEGDCVSELEWMEGRTTSDASRALCDMTHGVLAADESLALKRIFFYGMLVSPSGNRLMSLLKDRGVAREARLGQWCYFDNGPGTVYWCHWDAASDSEDEEDEEEEEEEYEKMRWNSLLPID